MDTTLFLKKYLGEVTLKNGEHVKFLFPVSEDIFNQTKEESMYLYKKIQKDQKSVRLYTWALVDNLTLDQFQIAYANIKKYGDNYWKIVWEHCLQKTFDKAKKV